jgi:hypothetical protein
VILPVNSVWYIRSVFIIHCMSIKFVLNESVCVHSQHILLMYWITPAECLKRENRNFERWRKR